jgi:NADH-quinone oxidoreductase subunit J
MTILWAVFAITALVGAILVVGAKNPVHSALGLVVTLCSTSTLYACLHAPFLAVAQVAVYAGAIMVVFIFVTMLLNVHREEGAACAPFRVQVGAVALAAAFAAIIGYLVWRALPVATPAAVGADFGSTPNIGAQLLGPLGLPFEIASLLLLVAAVGAIILAKWGKP